MKKARLRRAVSDSDFEEKSIAAKERIEVAYLSEELEEEELPQTGSSEENNFDRMVQESDEDFEQAAERLLSDKVPLWVKIALPSALVAIILVSFALGRYSVSPVELIQGFIRHFQGAVITQEELSLDKVIFNIRIPRISSRCSGGCCTCISGRVISGDVSQPSGFSRLTWCKCRCESWCLHRDANRYEYPCHTTVRLRNRASCGNAGCFSQQNGSI